MNSLMEFEPFDDEWLTRMQGTQMPTTDVYTKDDKEMVVEAHLPNFEEKDVSVQVLDDGSLEIQAEKHEKEEDKSKKYVVRESSTSFYRRIRLPQVVNADTITAHMKDGVLTVTVPLKALPKPKKVEVKKKK